MQVVAIRKGYCGVKIREAGEEFPFEGVLGSWMKLARDETPKATEQKVLEVEPVLAKPSSRSKKK